MIRKTLVSILLFIMPFSTLAYSERIIASGENVGITLNTDGVLIAGTYKIGSQAPANEAGLKSGDFITKINGEKVDSVDDLAAKIDKSNQKELDIEYKREGKKHNTTLELISDEDILKTGLYVKDNVSGIGTLTFIDPETKLFGALGHEILNQTTGKILEIKDGKILSSTVTGVIPSSEGNAGEKKAEYDKNSVEGEIKENTTQGVFGTYTGNIEDEETYKVADKNEIKEGEAVIRTVLSGKEVAEYDITITKITDNSAENKNFVFEITDDALLEKTGGIVQGMSGSPIIQGDYIVGAVTHVVVDEPSKGYGIFITNMLEEAEN